MSEQETSDWIVQLSSLGRLPGTLSSKPDLEFRIADANSDWPDIVLGVQQNGLYICRYGGTEADMFLGRLVSELASKFAEPGFTFVEL